jgi:cytochrome c oxidase accessory protein FixG
MRTTATSMTIEGRSVLPTLNDDGSRRWIRPKVSRGRFLTARRAVAYLLILLFAAAPYLRHHGRPLFLLELSTRRFTIFGYTFLPTDTVVFALFMVAVFVLIFLLTALFGRVWCGWACPQTVYMEFVYRPIERLFEGVPGKRKRGIAATAAAKPLRFLAYLLVSMFLAHTFLAWFVGVDRLLVWVQRSPLEHPAGFLVMAATTGLMLFDFGYFREQVCIVACPYGRFQSALLDRQSLIVSYDPGRGEPRGKARRSQPGEPEVGDCVDCEMCVATCPTGIDIRNGLQMECIGCAQCIDACDAVMSKLGRATGLIRYSSPSAIAGERRRPLRPRVIIYPLVLLIVVTALVLALHGKGPADTLILRGMGRPFTELAGGEVSNPVRIKIVNRTDAPVTYDIEPSAPGFRFVSEMNPVTIGPGEAATVPAEIIAPAALFAGGACTATLRISGGPAFVRDVPFRMMGPGRTRHEDEEHR